MLRTIRGKCERALRRGIQRAVITVPAYYNDNQRTAVVHAGRVAGLTVERVLNEPTAAAIAYGLGTTRPGRFLVYDLGGGTFDVSVMTVERGALQVVATAGDTFLGGEDFDNRLVQHLCDTFARRTGRRLSLNHSALALVKAAAEKAKTRLSVHETTTVAVRDVLLADGSTTRLELEVGRTELESLVAPLVDRSLMICDQALAAANLTVSQLSDVLLVGGQTRMPLVRRRVQEHFGRAPRCDLNPDEAVALGAGWLPHLAAKGETGFRDVLSMSIGTAIDDRFLSLIEQNTPVPHTRKIRLRIPKARFPTYSLGVWQGDESELRKNEYLGALRVDSVAPGDADPVLLDAAFSLSADCLLSVQLTNVTTHESMRVLLLSRE